MSTIKEPQDHLPKVEKPKVKDIDGGKLVTFPDLVAKTRGGKPVLKDEKPVPLAVTVLTVALDDFELLDDLRAIDVDRNASRLPALLRRLVGDEFGSVMDALRDAETGRVQIEPASVWIRDLMGALDPNS